MRDKDLNLKRLLCIVRYPIEIIVSVINFILLSIVYCIGIGFTALFAKILKKKFLETDKRIEQKTYWKDVRKKKDNSLRTF